MSEKATNPKDALGSTKLPLHLVSPIVKAYQAVAHYLGAVKYGSWNYRVAGARASVYRAALDRHMDAWWEGEEFDPVDGTPHLANALACIGILIDSKHSGKLVDDRPPGRPEALRELRDQFEQTMKSIREVYGDRHPRHYAREDALPVAPQQARFRNPLADAIDGWIDWHGEGKLPFASGDRRLVEVRLRDGTVRSAHAHSVRWETYGGINDVVAYRVLS